MQTSVRFALAVGVSPRSSNEKQLSDTPDDLPMLHNGVDIVCDEVCGFMYLYMLLLACISISVCAYKSKVTLNVS